MMKEHIWFSIFRINTVIIQKKLTSQEKKHRNKISRCRGFYNFSQDCIYIYIYITSVKSKTLNTQKFV